MMVININIMAVTFQDGMDEFFADEDTKVYWVSFLDGLQRMLLFTEDLAVAANAQEVLWRLCHCYCGVSSLLLQ